MKESGINSMVYGNPAWLTSLITAILSLLVPFIVAGIGFSLGKVFGLSSEELVSADNTVDAVGYFLTGIFVAMMCFKICKAHPKSVWYTPLVCNALTLIMGLNYFSGNLTLGQLLSTLGIGWVLSIIASILGANAGKRGTT